MFTPHQVSHVKCNKSWVNFVLLFLLSKWRSQSVEGLLSTGPTPSCLTLAILFNRLGVARAVIKTPLWLTDWFQRSFSSKSSKYIHSKTVWGMGLKFLENVPLPSCVMCLMSHVTCHMSFFVVVGFLDLVLELVAGGSLINGAYPV